MDYLGLIIIILGFIIISFSILSVVTLFRLVFCMFK